MIAVLMVSTVIGNAIGAFTVSFTQTGVVGVGLSGFYVQLFHGLISDVMRVAGVATDWGVPISLGNTFLKIAAHLALAMPEVRWLEYSVQNFDHLVEKTLVIRDALVEIQMDPGHGLILSNAGRS